MITSFGIKLARRKTQAEVELAAVPTPLPAPSARVSLRPATVVQAPVSIPAAAALQAPKSVAKRKFADLSERQFEVLLQALQKSGNSQAQALGNGLAQMDLPGFKPPHLLRHLHADGTLRAYVVSRTWSRGSYGKFRHVLLLGPRNVHLAAKDFRSGARFCRDLQKIYGRLAALGFTGEDFARLLYSSGAVADLVKRKVITQDQAKRIAVDAQVVMTSLKDGTRTPGQIVPIADDAPFVTTLLKNRTLTADQARGILFNEGHLRRLARNAWVNEQKARATLLTRFVEAPAVANEYELVARAKSPLAAIDKILVDGRILMITRVMDGELKVAKLPPAQSQALGRFVLSRVGKHMARAHALGVVHRDLKPENILFDLRAQDLVPSDFGLGAALVDGHTTGRVGSPGFAAPELFSQERYTAAADVFSLGMVVACLALADDLLPGQGLGKLNALPDFERIRDHCPKRADGMCDLSRIGPDPDNLSSLQAFSSSPANERDIRLGLREWYEQDPEVATYVFTKMLATAPAERDSMAQVGARFAGDAGVMNTTLAGFVQHDRVAAELAIMEAFGAAYLAEDS